MAPLPTGLALKAEAQAAAPSGVEIHFAHSCACSTFFAFFNRKKPWFQAKAPSFGAIKPKPSAARLEPVESQVRPSTQPLVRNAAWASFSPDQNCAMFFLGAMASLSAMSQSSFIVSGFL